MTNERLFIEINEDNSVYDGQTLKITLPSSAQSSEGVDFYFSKTYVENHNLEIGYVSISPMPLNCFWNWTLSKCGSPDYEISVPNSSTVNIGNHQTSKIPGTFGFSGYSNDGSDIVITFYLGVYTGDTEKDEPDTEIGQTVVFTEYMTTFVTDPWKFCSNITELVIPETVTNLGFYYTYEELDDPDEDYYHTVESSHLPKMFPNVKKITTHVVPDKAFYAASNVREIVLTSAVTSIGTEAFNMCTNLTKITIPDGVTSIGDAAFRNCGNLTDIAIPNGVMSLGPETFRFCGFVTLPYLGSVETIPSNCFQQCSSLTTAIIPDGVTSIGLAAFRDCTSLTSVTIPGSVTHIGGSVFHNTPWLAERQQENPIVIVNNILIDGKTCEGDVVIPEGVVIIAGSAFSTCSNITSVTIPNSVTSIGEEAFSYCAALTSITILEGVTSIEDSAFQWCRALTNITIPNSVTSMGLNTFFQCQNLTSITINKPEGSIYGAPWGARNATIVWNG